MANAKHTTTLEEHLTERYGELGTKQRDEFEAKAKAFIIGEMLKEERLQAHLTQEELADKIGAKKAIYPELKTVKQIFNYQHYIKYLNWDWVRK